MEYHILTDAEKREICSWQYEGEYAAYNLPSYEEMQEKKMSFVNPAKAENFLGYCVDGVLVGFTNLVEEDAEVFLGVGVSPNLCGRGYGRKIVETACAVSKERYPDKPLYLEVRTWNLRAVRCYQHAGFRIDGDAFEQKTYAGTGTFYRMIHD